jgi:hypothetical protein
MTKEVLVLCQRKSGKIESRLYSSNDVEELIIPRINEIVQEQLGSDTNIKYLSDMKGTIDGSADYKFSLYSSNPEAKEFISNHIGFYSLIILNTCPFLYMDFKIIYDLLKPGGIMSFNTFPNTSANIFLPEEKITEIDTLFENIGKNLYRKKQSGGKKRKTYKKRTYKKRKTRKIKSRKIRKI